MSSAHTNRWPWWKTNTCGWKWRHCGALTSPVSGLRSDSRRRTVSKQIRVPVKQPHKWKWILLSECLVFISSSLCSSSSGSRASIQSAQRETRRADHQPRRPNEEGELPHYCCFFKKDKVFWKDVELIFSSDQEISQNLESFEKIFCYLLLSVCLCRTLRPWSCCQVQNTVKTTCCEPDSSWRMSWKIYDKRKVTGWDFNLCRQYHL